MFDLVVRGGMIVDGTGSAPYEADVAIKGRHIVAVERHSGPARLNIDARGKIVTPGWVDIHSHYDGQATWDPHLSPSGAHGVTTVVMGNCGVGFAPVRRDSHDWLIGLMEGVEDIPGTALAEGIKWDWESFPEYLDSIEKMPRVADVAAQIPHRALRAYVMGEREAIRGIASSAQLAQMASLVRDSVRAGALGFSSSRTKLHLAADGSPVPGSFAELIELEILASATAEGGGGVFQIVSDLSKPDIDFQWLCRIASSSKLQVLFTLVQYDDRPSDWRNILSMTDNARSDGVRVAPLVGNRPVGMLINIESKTHPFSDHPSFRRLHGLSRNDLLHQMSRPEMRAQLLQEHSLSKNKFWRQRMQQFDSMFRLGTPPEYEPEPEQSIGAEARRRGCSPLELVYDLLLQNDGKEWIYLPLINYSDGNLQPQLEMMNHPDSIVGLADGGAHCGLICDATAPNFMLVHWVKNRKRGPRISLQHAVWMQTSRTAQFYGMRDRGTLAAGKLADINVIDFERLMLEPPHWASDLPAGGRRLLQDARGYDYTIKSGVTTWMNGKPTGAFPGTLVRGPQT
jgi:N-acyl-D-aspartate/D-glutamate deacylase